MLQADGGLNPASEKGMLCSLFRSPNCRTYPFCGHFFKLRDSTGLCDVLQSIREAEINIGKFSGRLEAPEMPTGRRWIVLSVTLIELFCCTTLYSVMVVRKQFAICSFALQVFNSDFFVCVCVYFFLTRSKLLNSAKSNSSLLFRISVLLKQYMNI